MRKNVLRKSLALFLALFLCVPVALMETTGVAAATAETSKVAALDFSKQGETSAFVTKQAFPGGSTFSFDAFVPSGVTWWGVAWTTDPADTSIYNLFSSGTGIVSGGNNAWATYSYTLPDEGNYYLYFAAECNATAWAGKTILVDNFTVTNVGIEIAYEGFNTFLNACMFKTNTPGVVTLVDYAYSTAVIAVDKISSTDNSQMSFITKKSYPGGSTISFEAYVPSGTSWWGLCWTTDAGVNSIYDVFSNGKSFSSQNNQWATYTAILPDDGNDYYFYIGGAVGEWHEKSIQLDNVVIKDKNGDILVTDGFENGLSASIFKCDSKAVTVLGDFATESVNTYAAINIDNICSEDNKPMSFITKQAYPGGSTVTFDAFVPSGASWWGLCWTTDPNETSIYNCWSLGTTFSVSADTWTTCTATLPSDGNYYLYFVGAVGEWDGKELLIDNVAISKAGTVYAAEDFSAGLCNSIFNFVKANSSDLPVVTLKPETTVDTAYAASVAIDRISSSNNSQMSFITKKAYPSGSTVSFDAFIPSNTSWWGICWTTDAKVNSIYNGWSLGKVFSATADEWATYTATLPDDGNDYYFYFVGAVGEWNGKEMLIDNVYVQDAKGYTLAEENFDNGIIDGTFVSDSAVTLVDTTPSEPIVENLRIGTQTKNDNTRLIMKLCDDQETVEAYETLAFKIVIDGKENIVTLDTVYTGFLDEKMGEVSAESLDCTYVAICEIGDITTAESVTVQGIINDTEFGAVRTLK